MATAVQTSAVRSRSAGACGSLDAAGAAFAADRLSTIKPSPRRRAAKWSNATPGAGADPLEMLALAAGHSASKRRVISMMARQRERVGGGFLRLKLTGALASAF